MKIIAHRGDHTTVPENTLEAFIAASQAGAEWIELDVFQCASGELVVMHDEDVSRTTTGTGAVGEHTLATLKTFAAKNINGDVTHFTIPTLTEIFLALPNINICIELKGPNTALAVAQFLNDHPHQGSILISSFKKTELLVFNQKRPDTPFAVTLWGTPTKDEIALYASWGASMIHLDWNDGDIDSSVVSAIHEHGMTLWAYTVNTAEIAHKMNTLGVDGIFTDRYALVSGVL